MTVNNDSNVSSVVPASSVADTSTTATNAANDWGSQFEASIVHLNVEQRSAVRLARSAQDYALILGYTFCLVFF